jgi:O-antigen ligase
VTSPLLPNSSALVSPLGMPGPSRLSKFIFWGTFGLLLFGPVAFGTTEPWSIFIQQASAAVLLAAWLLQQVRTGSLEINSNPLFMPMIAFAGVIVIELLTRGTAYRYATYTDGMLYVGYGILCFLTVQNLRRTRQVRILAKVFSVYGFIVAVFAILQSVSASNKLYWLRAPRFGGWVYGPYVNHNHYAGLMEMLVPIPLVFALSQHARTKHRRMALAAAAVMAGTIFLSGSRGGMLAFAVQMCVLAAVLACHRRRPGIGRIISGFLAALLILLLWLGSSSLLDRLATLDSNPHKELSAAARLTIYHDAFRMFTQRPLLGWGLGTFSEVYPQFQTLNVDALVDQAHNDYLQFLVETGVLGFAVAIFLIVTLYRHALAKLGNWERDINSTVALAAMLACTGILVHSFVDFNLQIPGNAALFYVMATIAAMHPCFGTPRRRLHSAIEEVVPIAVTQEC